MRAHFVRVARAPLLARITLDEVAVQRRPFETLTTRVELLHATADAVAQVFAAVRPRWLLRRTVAVLALLLEDRAALACRAGGANAAERLHRRATASVAAVGVALDGRAAAGEAACVFRDVAFWAATGERHDGVARVTTPSGYFSQAEHLGERKAPHPAAVAFGADARAAVHAHASSRARFAPTGDDVTAAAGTEVRATLHRLLAEQLAAATSARVDFNGAVGACIADGDQTRATDGAAADGVDANARARFGARTKVAFKAAGHRNEENEDQGTHKPTLAGLVPDSSERSCAF